jgi:hypothetical protein
MCTGRVGMGSSPPARLLALLLLLAVAPRDSTPQQGAAPPAIDACGCRGGSGWSLATGRGCCAAGSQTVPDQHMSSCRSAMGNTDCAPPGDANPAIAVTPAIGAPAAAGAPNDACGCPTGYGWSLTTGRGCCKPGSLTSEAEQSTCHSTHGNMDCAAVAGSAPASVAAAPAPAATPAIGAPAAAGAPNDACGCPTGYGWSLTTGRGCCKQGSLTSEAEQSTCHSTHGNMDCAAVAGSAPASVAAAPAPAAPAATPAVRAPLAAPMPPQSAAASTAAVAGGSDGQHAFDLCGCRAGFGWSTATGRGCCASGTVTQPGVEQSCQPARGNTDCTPLTLGSYQFDACGCSIGYGWSTSTGRGCCKRGSITQSNEERRCRKDIGNLDCGGSPVEMAAITTHSAQVQAPTAATNPVADVCGCPLGYGWSLTTGRGCCKQGSLTSEAEQSTCHSTHGNMDCAAVAGSAPAAAPAPLVAAPAATTVPTQHTSGEVMANGPISSVPVGQLEPEGIMDEAAAPAGEARFS